MLTDISSGIAAASSIAAPAATAQKRPIAARHLLKPAAITPRANFCRESAVSRGAEEKPILSIQDANAAAGTLLGRFPANWEVGTADESAILSVLHDVVTMSAGTT